ncbi:MAG: hypothetical protein KAW49_01755, partial [Anaerolineae bacterium]|nr:hypothetical protein [Anaerolineae bacterium]
MSTKFLSSRLTLLATVSLLLLGLIPSATPAVGHRRELNRDDGGAQFGLIVSEAQIGDVKKGDEYNQGRLDPQYSSASFC